MKQPKLIQNPSGTYSVVVMTQFGRRQMTTGSRDKNEARKIVTQAKVGELETTAKAVHLSQAVVSQILNGRKVTVIAACAEWTAWMKTVGRSSRTIATGQETIWRWSKDQWLDGQFPSAIKEKQISDWINDTKSTAKYSTRSLSLNKIRSFFEFCSAKGYVNGNPAKLVEVDYSLLSHEQKEATVKRVLSEEEMDRLMLYVKSPGFWHVAIALGRWTGLRISDICLLEWESIKDPTKVVVWTRKTDARIDVPVPMDLLPILCGLKRDSSSRYVFPDIANDMLNPKLRSTFSNQFGRICERIGIKDASFHCLRHTFATNMRAKGTLIPHISKAMGHANTTTTERYIHA